MPRLLTLGVAIPAIDFTINSVILFDRLKAVITISMMPLCFGAIPLEVM